jgi:hypothetical protein
VIIDLLGAGVTFEETRVFLEDPRPHVSCAALAEAEVTAVDLPALLPVRHDLVVVRIRSGQKLQRFAEAAGKN